MVTMNAGCVLSAGAAVTSVVADAVAWIPVPRAVQAGLVLLALFVMPVAGVGVRAVWVLRGRAELFAAAETRHRERPADRQMIGHLRDEHPLTPLWWMVAVLGGLTALCLGFALPFALAGGAVLDGVLLGAGLAVSLLALAAAVPGIRHADRQGEEDRRRRTRLWPVPTALERRLAEPLLGSGDGAHLGT
ncbi:hypothetical protein [Streptomyces sp. NPDC057418]|uniref:hypothetical protein n=1 Tax=unclassified Streptomyces TaxID=2593676 RepID=UPI0036AEC559